MLCRTFWNNKYIYISVLAIDQLNAQILFFFNFIIYLYMFQALLCSSSGGQIVLYSICYRHNETSGWSKITKYNSTWIVQYLVILDHPLVSLWR